MSENNIDELLEKEESGKEEEETKLNPSGEKDVYKRQG